MNLLVSCILGYFIYFCVKTWREYEPHPYDWENGSVARKDVSLGKYEFVNSALWNFDE